MCVVRERERQRKRDCACVFVLMCVCVHVQGRHEDVDELAEADRAVEDLRQEVLDVPRCHAVLLEAFLGVGVDGGLVRVVGHEHRLGEVHQLGAVVLERDLRLLPLARAHGAGPVAEGSHVAGGPPKAAVGRSN